MSNADKSKICPFIQFTWEQLHQLAIVNTVPLNHSCLLFAAKLVTVYNAVHFQRL